MVSVLVTVYNREAFLAACLESILASDFTDFEVVISDDASSDRSVSIASGYAARDERITLHRNEANLGDYPNRMRAAELARGRFLKYVDSDDLIYPHGLGVMVNAMTAHPAAALGLAHSSPDEDEPYPWLLSSEDAWRKEFLGGGCIASGPTGAIIRRDAFFEVGGFRAWGVLSDTDLWYRMSGRWPVVLLAPGLVWWRRHDDQEFVRNGADLVYLERGFELVRESLADARSPLSASDREKALDRMRHRYSRKLLSLGLKQGRLGTAVRLMRRAELSAGEIIRGFAPYY